MLLVVGVGWVMEAAAAVVVATVVEEDTVVMEEMAEKEVGQCAATET